MPRINEAFLNLRASYLFAEVKQRTLGIIARASRRPADRPRHRRRDAAAARTMVQALARGHATSRRGPRRSRATGPTSGYEFLRSARSRRTTSRRAASSSAATRSSSATAARATPPTSRSSSPPDSVVALMDPAYPVYADANVMAGRSGPADASGRYAGFVYLPCTAENDFQPALPDRHVDLIYLCYPNNPDRRGDDARGAPALGRLRARARGHHPLRRRLRGLHPRSGDPPLDLRDRGRARRGHRVAQLLEERRASPACAWPTRSCRATCAGADRGRDAASLNQLWLRRAADQVQRAAVHRPAGRRGRLHTGRPEAGARADRPLHGQRAHPPRGLRSGRGSPCTAGATRPTSGSARPRARRRGTSSTALLAEAQVVGVPGSGFGPSGEGYFRVTAFGSRADSEEAVERDREPAPRAEPSRAEGEEAHRDGRHAAAGSNAAHHDPDPRVRRAGHQAAGGGQDLRRGASLRRPGGGRGRRVREPDGDETA